MAEDTNTPAPPPPPVDFLTLAGSAFERIFRLSRLLGKHGYQWLDGRTAMTIVIPDRVYLAIQEHQLFQVRRAGRMDMVKSIRTGELTVHEGLWTIRLVAEGRLAPIQKEPEEKPWEQVARLSKDPEFMAREAEKLRNTKVESPIQDAIFGKEQKEELSACETIAEKINARVRVELQKLIATKPDGPEKLSMMKVLEDFVDRQFVTVEPVNPEEKEETKP